jgi:hypothetical protein
MIQGIATWISPQVVAPGQSYAVLRITLINTLNFTIYNAFITPVSSPPFTFITSPLFINRWTPFQAITMDVPVNISSNARLGTYVAIVNIYNTTLIARAQISIPIAGFVSFKLQALWGTLQSPMVVFPGAQNLPLTLLIVNTGNTIANNVVIYLKDYFPLHFVENKINLGVINGGSSVTLTILASISQNANIGVYRIPITLQYFNQNSTYYLDIPVTGNFTPIISVIPRINNQSIGPYEYGVPITLTLFYSSPFPVYLIEIKATLPNGIHNTSGGNLLYYSQPGQGNSGIINAVFLVNTGNVTLGIYNITGNVTLRVISNGVTLSYIKNFSVPIYVKGTVSLKLYSNTSTLQVGLNFVRIFVKNEGSGDAYNLTIVPSILPQVSVLYKSNQIPILKAGEVKSIDLTIYVPIALQGSALTINFNIIYINSNFITSFNSIALSFYIPLTQTSNVIIVWSDNSTLLQNSMNNITVNLKNISNQTLNNITVNLISQSLVIIGKNFYSIPQLKPNTVYKIPLTVYVPNLIQGIGSLQVVIQYFTPSMALQSESNLLNFYAQQPVMRLNPIILLLSPDTLISGTVQYAKLIIKNSASEVFTNISVSITSPLSFLNATILYIDKLQPNQSKEFPIKFVIPVGINSLQIQFNIVYYNINRQIFTEQQILNIPVVGSVNFLLTQVSTVQTPVNRTTVLSVTATIVNYGTGNAIGVIAIPKPPEGVSPIINGSTYIGNVAPYTPTTFTISFLVNTEQLKNNSFSIPITLIYTNNLGQISNQSLSIPVSITPQAHQQSRSSGGILLFWPIIALIIIIIVVISIILLKVVRKR